MTLPINPATGQPYTEEEVVNILNADLNKSDNVTPISQTPTEIDHAEFNHMISQAAAGVDCAATAAQEVADISHLDSLEAIALAVRALQTGVDALNDHKDKVDAFMDLIESVIPQEFLHPTANLWGKLLNIFGINKS